MALQIYHNPRCSKSRAGLQYLIDKGEDVEVVEYLKSTITREEIETILLKTNLEPQDLIRTQEAIYKSDFKGKNFTRDEWITILIENPKLIERPIVIGKHKAVIARPAEKIDELL